MNQVFAGSARPQAFQCFISLTYYTATDYNFIMTISDKVSDAYNVKMHSIHFGLTVQCQAMT